MVFQTHTCHICMSEFKSGNTLYSHIRSIHMAETPAKVLLKFKIFIQVQKFYSSSEVIQVQKFYSSCKKFYSSSEVLFSSDSLCLHWLTDLSSHGTMGTGDACAPEN